MEKVENKKIIPLGQVLPYHWDSHFMELIRTLYKDYDVTDLAQVIYLNALICKDYKIVYELCDERLGSKGLTPKKVNALFSAMLIEKRWNRSSDAFPDTILPTEEAVELFNRYNKDVDGSGFESYSDYLTAKLYKKVVTEDHLEEMGAELLEEFPLTGNHSQGGSFSLRSYKLGLEIGIPPTQDAFLKLYYKKLGYGSKPFDEVLAKHREVIDKLKYIKRKHPAALSQGIAQFINDRFWLSIKLPKNDSEGDANDFGIML